MLRALGARGRGGVLAFGLGARAAHGEISLLGRGLLGEQRVAQAQQVALHEVVVLQAWD